MTIVGVIVLYQGQGQGNINLDLAMYCIVSTMAKKDDVPQKNLHQISLNRDIEFK